MLDKRQKKLDQRFFFTYLLIYLLHFVYGYIACVSINKMHTVSAKSQRCHQVFTNWSYRYMQASLQVWGIHPWSSWKVTSTLSHWVISSFPKTKVFKLWIGKIRGVLRIIKLQYKGGIYTCQHFSYTQLEYWTNEWILD